MARTSSSLRQEERTPLLPMHQPIVPRSSTCKQSARKGKQAVVGEAFASLGCVGTHMRSVFMPYLAHGRQCIPPVMEAEEPDGRPGVPPLHDLKRFECCTMYERVA